MPPQQPNYHDPAIMSAGYLPNNPTGGEHMYMNHGNAPRNYQNPMMAYGPPPGLQFRQSAAPSPAVSSQHGGSGQSMDSAHGESLTSYPQGREFVKNTERRTLPVRNYYYRA
jgi:hypothetical protein